MSNPHKVFLLALFLSSSLGCMAPVGASTVSIPKDAGNDCAQQCAQIGLRLSAVAIMANHIGCVCQPTSASQADQGSAPAGMATIAMIQERERQQQQQQQQAHRR